MFINFAKKMFELLIEDEFTYIKRIDNRLVYDTEALSLYKDKGSILYIATIFNVKEIDKQKYDNHRDKLSRLFKDDRKGQLILMDIFVNDGVEHSGNADKFWINEDYTPNKRIYVFNYSVCLENADVYTPNDQPDLLDIKKKIHTAIRLMDEAYVNGTHLETLEKDLDSRYSLPVVSNNCRLTLGLMSINVVVWLLMEYVGSSENIYTLMLFGAMSRDSVILRSDYFRLFTSMFLHIGFWHLINNCLSLYIFGSRIERHLGKYKMIIIYLVSGIAGNAASIHFLPGISAGASGAIFGLLGAILAVSYKIGRSFADLSPYVIVFLCIYLVGFGFVAPGVNNFAHLGGFFAGAAIGLFCFKKSYMPQDNSEFADSRQTDNEEDSNA